MLEFAFDDTMEHKKDSVDDKREPISFEQRVPSPSSVSSSNSVRPLEWDSGADIGYHQYLFNAHSSDTVEHTAVEEQSPNSAKIVDSHQFSYRRKIGQPIANSTIAKSFSELRHDKKVIRGSDSNYSALMSELEQVFKEERVFSSAYSCDKKHKSSSTESSHSESKSDSGMIRNRDKNPKNSSVECFSLESKSDKGTIRNRVTKSSEVGQEFKKAKESSEKESISISNCKKFLGSISGETNSSVSICNKENPTTSSSEFVQLLKEKKEYFEKQLEKYSCSEYLSKSNENKKIENNVRKTDSKLCGNERQNRNEKTYCDKSVQVTGSSLSGSEGSSSIEKDVSVIERMFQNHSISVSNKSSPFSLSQTPINSPSPFPLSKSPVNSPPSAFPLSKSPVKRPSSTFPLSKSPVKSSPSKLVKMVRKRSKSIPKMSPRRLNRSNSFSPNLKTVIRRDSRINTVANKLIGGNFQTEKNFRSESDIARVNSYCREQNLRVYKNENDFETDSFEYIDGATYERSNATKPRVHSPTDVKRGSVSKAKEIEISLLRNDSDSINLDENVHNGLQLITEYISKLNTADRSKVAKNVAQQLLTNCDRSIFQRQKTDSESACETKQTFLELTPDDPQKSIRLAQDKELGKKDNESNDFTDNCVRSSQPLQCYPNRCTSDDNNFGISGSSSQIIESSSSMSRLSNLKYHPLSATLSSSPEVNVRQKHKRRRPDGVKKLSRSGKEFFLKEYFAKERETQIMWMQAGINHLENLKKLYENQKSLRSSIEAFKNSDIASGESEVIPDNRKGRRLNKKRTSARKPLADNQIYNYESSNDFELCNRENILAKGHKEKIGNTNSIANENQISVSDSRVYKYSNDQNKLQSDQRSNYQSSRDQRKNKKSYAEIWHSENLGYLASDSFRHYAGDNFLDSFLKSGIRLEKRLLDAEKENTEKRKTPLSRHSNLHIAYTLSFEKKVSQPFAHHYENGLLSHAQISGVKSSKSKKIKSKIPLIVKEQSTTSGTENVQHSPLSRENENKTTLQEYLRANHPQYVNRAETRRQILSEIAKLREVRDKAKRELLMKKGSEVGVCDRITPKSSLPPRPLAVKRLFTHKALRSQTERKYRQLPEVRNKVEEKRRLEDYRTNQLMKNIFSKKLQRRVLNGKVNLSNSSSIIFS